MPGARKNHGATWMRTPSMRTGRGYRCSVSSRALARASAAAFCAFVKRGAASGRRGLEDEDRLAVLQVLHLEAVALRVGQAVDRRDLVGRDRLRGRHRIGQRLRDRVAQLVAEVVAL